MITPYVYLSSRMLIHHTIDELLQLYPAPIIFLDEDGDTSNIVTRSTKDNIVFDKTETMNKRMNGNWHLPVRRSPIDDYGFASGIINTNTIITTKDS